MVFFPFPSLFVFYLFTHARTHVRTHARTFSRPVSLYSLPYQAVIVFVCFFLCVVSHLKIHFAAAVGGDVATGADAKVVDVAAGCSGAGVDAGGEEVDALFALSSKAFFFFAANASIAFADGADAESDDLASNALLARSSSSLARALTRSRASLSSRSEDFFS